MPGLLLGSEEGADNWTNSMINASGVGMQSWETAAGPTLSPLFLPRADILPARNAGPGE